MLYCKQFDVTCMFSSLVDTITKEFDVAILLVVTLLSRALDNLSTAKESLFNKLIYKLNPQTGWFGG